jgi:haloalkane dehalogenase
MKSDQSIDISKIRDLYPFQSHWLDINGLQYHYVDEGTGEPIIMVHGNPTWSFYYRSLIRGLSPEYRTIAVDHIGCGLSEKPPPERYPYRLKNRVDDLERLIDHLALDRKLTFVAHDWGGMIVLAYALRHIGRIGRLIITNTSGFFPPGGKPIPMRLRLIRNTGWLGTLSVQGLNLFARSALFMASAKGLSKPVKTGLITPYNSWNNRIATLQFVRDIPVTRHDPSFQDVQYVDQHLHQLEAIPMLICWGERDFVFNMHYRDEWQRRFPHARMVCFPEAGHYLLEDAPGTVRSQCIQFLKDTAL